MRNDPLTDLELKDRPELLGNLHTNASLVVGRCVPPQSTSPPR